MTGIEIVIYADIYQVDVAGLIVPIQRDEFGVSITIDDQPDLKDIPGFYQNGNGNFWVAVQDGRVVGTIGVKDIGNSSVALRKMFVHAACRGQQFGVGQALLNTVLEWARHKMVHTILLGTTDQFLAAHRFYEKNGFQEVDRQALPAAFPVMAVDNKFYRYRFE
jgi:N-acetylglutamate synthase-like GNAT family acetyltransferase